MHVNAQAGEFDAVIECLEATFMLQGLVTVFVRMRIELEGFR